MLRRCKCILPKRKYQKCFSGKKTVLQKFDSFSPGLFHGDYRLHFILLISIRRKTGAADTKLLRVDVNDSSLSLIENTLNPRPPIQCTQSFEFTGGNELAVSINSNVAMPWNAWQWITSSEGEYVSRIWWLMTSKWRILSG